MAACIIVSPYMKLHTSHIVVRNQWWCFKSSVLIAVVLSIFSKISFLESVLKYFSCFKTSNGSVLHKEPVGELHPPPKAQWEAWPGRSGAKNTREPWNRCAGEETARTKGGFHGWDMKK